MRARQHQTPTFAAPCGTVRYGSVRYGTVRFGLFSRDRTHARLDASMTTTTRDEHTTLLADAEAGGRSSTTTSGSTARRACAVVAGSVVVGAVAIGAVAGLSPQNVKAMIAARVGEWAGVNGVLLAPPPKARAGAKSPTTFKVYTQCKSAEVKAAGGDFWFSPLESASIVRHNYESSDFFGEEKGIPMVRAELEDGVYGYTVTTDQVDFEWGFQLKNKKGEYWKEIGTTDTGSPLAAGMCVQKYGKYFNRVLTLEENPALVTYRLGTCDKECPSDFSDTAFCAQPFTAAVGNSEATAVDLGTVDDARLINFASALMHGTTSVIDPSGRAETFRYNEGSATEQLWIVAIGDYSREYVKMVQVKVVVDPVTHQGKAFVTESRRYTHKSNAGYAYQHWTTPYSNRDGCKMGYCNVARYNIPTFWDQGVAFSGLSIQRMEFVKLSLGDSPPTAYNEVYDGNFLTSNRQILKPGEWGEDMDVRRVILKNGVLCGGAIHHKNCMFGKAFAADSKTVAGYAGPTKTSKQWLIIVIEHNYFKMVRIEISLNANKGVDARVVDAGYVGHTRTSDVLTSDSMANDGSAKWAQRSHMPVASSFDSGGYGVGGIKFDLAAEMSTSLLTISC